MRRKAVWILGTSPAGKGGIASVIHQYAEGGLIDSDRILFVATHHDRNPIGRLIPFIGAICRLWLALVMGRVGLVHVHSSYGGSFWRKFVLVLPAFSLGVPVITHLHGSQYMGFYSSGSRFTQRCVRTLFRCSYRVVALSNEWREWVYRVEPESSVLVLFNSLAKSTGGQGSDFPSVNPTALFLGRVGERKGTFDLLAAFSKVVSAIPEARLVIGGDGDISRLNSEIERLGVSDHVSYVGWADARMKEVLLRECWVFVLPSYHEGMPMAILEAMAFSRAVISCPVGGIPQAVKDEKTGFLVAAGDVTAMADRLRCLLSNKSASLTMGAAGRRLFEQQFCHEAVWPQLYALYEEAMCRELPPSKTDRSKE